MEQNADAVRYRLGVRFEVRTSYRILQGQVRFACTSTRGESSGRGLVQVWTENLCLLFSAFAFPPGLHLVVTHTHTPFYFLPVVILFFCLFVLFFPDYVPFVEYRTYYPLCCVG